MIATVTLGERLDTRCVEALHEGISRAVEIRARVLVVTGEPGQFCLGMRFEPVPDRASLVGFATVMRALLLAPLPTLAVVDGPALGGGLGVTAACDYVLASERARFGLPEALYGLAPAIIRPALLRRLSPQRLAMLIATIHSRSASEALAVGLVDEVATDLAAAQSRVVRSLRRASSETIVAVRRWDAATLEVALAAGVDETAAALERLEVRAAITSEEPAWL